MGHEFFVQSLFQELGIDGLETSEETGCQSSHGHRDVVEEVAHAGKRVVTHSDVSRWDGRLLRDGHSHLGRLLNNGRDELDCHSSHSLVIIQ